MLELNGLKCWVTTSDLVAFSTTLTSTDSPRIAACTVKLPSNRKASCQIFFRSDIFLEYVEQSFIIHWSSTTPITAWCEVNLKNSSGKVNAGVVKCEMDANHPATQKRSTQEYRGVSGRNLAFGGRKLPTSGNLGAAWVEIRRATAIEVNEVSTLNKKLTITWVASDHPDSGVPFVTFIINFELDEQATSGTILSSPGISSIARSSVRRESTEEKTENGIPNPDSSNGDFGEFTSPTPTGPTVETQISESTAQDPNIAEVPSGSGAQKRGREDSQGENNAPELKRSRMEEATVPTIPVQNPQIPELSSPKVPDWTPGLRFKSTKPLKMPNVIVPKLPGPLMLVPIPQKPLPAIVAPKTPIQTTHTETPVPAVPTSPLSVQTQPDVPTPQTPNQTQSDVADSTTPVRNTMPKMALDLSEDEGDDFESKLAMLEVEIEACTKEFAKVTEKEAFMKVKRRRIQSVIDIKSLEAICGPILSKTPTDDAWDLIHDDVSDDEKRYSEKTVHMEETLPSLENYRTALQYKKTYVEKKMTLKRLRKDVHSAEQRCGEIFADITEILSTPRQTPS